jgi:hypothetical protein
VGPIAAGLLLYAPVYMLQYVTLRLAARGKFERARSSGLTSAVNVQAGSHGVNLSVRPQSQPLAPPMVAVALTALLGLLLTVSTVLILNGTLAFGTLSPPAQAAFWTVAIGCVVGPAWSSQIVNRENNRRFAKQSAMTLAPKVRRFVAALDSLWDTESRLVERYGRLGLKMPMVRFDLERNATVAAFLHDPRGPSDRVLHDIQDATRGAESDLRELERIEAEIGSVVEACQQARTRAAEVSDRFGEHFVESIQAQVVSPALLDDLANKDWSRVRRELVFLMEELARFVSSDQFEATKLSGGADAFRIPTSVDDAHRLLHVDPTLPMDAKKAQVTRLRKLWHPDLAQEDTIEWGIRTKKTKQINAAWDLIHKGRP